MKLWKVVCEVEGDIASKHFTTKNRAMLSLRFDTILLEDAIILSNTHNNYRICRSRNLTFGV